MPTQLSRILVDGASESGAFAQTRLPIFPRPVKECTTADSSPYVCSIDDFKDRYGTNDDRTRLIAQLTAFTEGSGELRVRMSALLVGGSFLDHSIDRPKDIDCLAFYSIDAPDEDVDDIISRWTSFRKQFPLDVKICPTDAGSLTIIKRSIFFSNLFSIDKASLILDRGTVLIHLLDD